MMARAGKYWGTQTVRLQLPASLITFKGLSRAQRRAIIEDYGSFVVGSSVSCSDSSTVCHAVRLDQPVQEPLERFNVDGKYTPKRIRSGFEIEITGFRFKANIPRDGSSLARSALLVWEEDELAQGFVLENFLRILLAHRAIDRGGVLLHSAGVVYRGRAFLFSGRSTAGKTTLARKAAMTGAQVLSDDINLVVPQDGEYRAHKVPFTGEFGRTVENMSGPGSVPLGGLALLEKAPVLTAAPVSPAEAVAGLLTGSPFVNDDPEEFPALMDVLTGLVARTPVVRLGMALEDSFEAVMETMTRHCGDE